MAASSVAASRFPCLEHNFVTVGPNHSKLGMHMSGDTSVSMKHVKFRKNFSHLNSEEGSHVCFVIHFTVTDIKRTELLLCGWEWEKNKSRQKQKNFSLLIIFQLLMLYNTICYILN